MGTPRQPQPPTEEEIARIFSILVGAQAPIERTDLARAAGLKERTARKAVTELVLRGEPVITLNDGYRLTNDPSLIRAEVRSLRHRAGEILRRADALAARLHPTQPDLF